MVNEILNEIIEVLKGNKRLVITRIENQYGETISDKVIFIKNGRFYLEYINCYSSSWLGLGTCLCNSHPSYCTDEISFNEFIEYLIGYINDKIKKLKEEEHNEQRIKKLIDILQSLE